MAYSNLRQFIQKLDQMGELAHVSQPISPRLEMTEINDRMVKTGGKALFFENTGTNFPVLLNAFGSERRICAALGVPSLDSVGQRIDQLMKTATTPPEGLMGKLRMLPFLADVAKWMPKRKKGRGECQQVVMPTPDMRKLPVLTCWPHDGGPFITLPLVHTIHPETGHRNTGMYRVQVFTPTTVGMHWQLHKTGTRHYQAWKKIGQRMPVAIVLGGDPVYTYAATAPLPENIDEYMLAGFLRQKNVHLVKCLTNEIYVPQDADFIIEGYVDVNEDLAYEGPFGDHTGYYSLADYYPMMHVTCITHRRDAVYPATVVGIPPQEDEWLGKATERIFLSPIRLTMNPEVVDMALPTEGVFHNIALVSIQKEWQGQALKVMNSLWGAGQMMFNKVMVVVKNEVNVHDYRQVMASLSQNVDVLKDVHFFSGPADVLDHAMGTFAYGGKLGIDATQNRQLPAASVQLEEVKSLLKTISEISNYSFDLAPEGILLLSIKKDKPAQVKQLHQMLAGYEIMSAFRVVVYAEEVADLQDLPSLVWRVANNIDPSRDCYLATDTAGNRLPLLAIDGTRKYAAFDGFNRQWPNIVTMNKETILAIDEKWAQLGLGPFIASPSLKYIGQLYTGGAVAEE